MVRKFSTPHIYVQLVEKARYLHQSGAKLRHHKVRGTQLINFQNIFLVGARGAIVEEPLAWVEEYPIQWREPRLDLAELAKLRWISGLSTKELAKRFKKTECAIGNYYQEARRLDFQIPGLTDNERKRIKWASKN